MSKNVQLLKEVSEYFTEQTLKDAVAKAQNIDSSKVTILSWGLETLSGKGNNYLSAVTKVSINYVVDNVESATSVIVKKLPQNLLRRQILRSGEYFQNEYIFYDKIATKFVSYLKSKNQSELLSIPLCLARYHDGDNDFLVLENVTLKGFHNIPRQKTVSYNQCKYFLEASARFHAISMAFKNDNKAEFIQMSSMINEIFFRTDLYESSLKYFYDSLFRIAKDALAKEYPGSRAETVFNSHQAEELFRKTVDICRNNTSADTSVISQGDSWVPNFMIRNENSQKPDILIFDFQMARCVSPVLDVAYFIYQCTNKSVRDNYYETLVNDYYVELAKTMTILGANPYNMYPKDVFRKELKEQSLYGLMFALMNIPLGLMPESYSTNEDAIKAGVADIAALGSMPNLENPEDRKRLADVIVHAVENGII